MQYGWDAYLQKQAQQAPEQQQIHRCEYEVSPGNVIVLEFDPIRNPLGRAE